MPLRGFAATLFVMLPLAAVAQAGSSLAPRVAVETTHGDFVLELDAVRAPLTAENFLRYVRDGLYDGTLFHRVIAGFVVQGGGYTAGFREVPLRAAIPNESGNGLSNQRGTIGLARMDAPHSGNSQFYLNVADNLRLDPLPSRWGYAVFGRVVSGMEVVDRLASLPTGALGPFGQDVPLERPRILRARVLGDSPADPPPVVEAAPAPDAPEPESEPPPPPGTLP